MKSAFYRWMAVFLALWLPVSTIAAAAMPVCVHETAKHAQAAHAMEQAGEQHHGCPDQDRADDGGKAGECAQCGLCLFAATPWLSGTPAMIEAIGSVAVVEGVFLPLHSLVLPPADRPPLAAA